MKRVLFFMICVFMAPVVFAETAVSDRNVQLFQAAHDANLIGWWKFDETEGNTAVDSSGKGNDGTLVGSPVWRPQGGKIGGALEFSGKGDYVKIANEPAFDITNQITISAWVNITSVPQDRTCI